MNDMSGMQDDIEAQGRRPPEDLEAIATIVKATAEECQGDCLALLALLRLLEALHQEIRDTLFQNSLPDSRQALSALLRDIEVDGGWPYIHRIRLQSLLTYLLEEERGEG